MLRLAPGRALFRLQISTKSGKTEASYGPKPAKMLAGTTLGQARAMDGAGRPARSMRSLGPQADLKAAAIGAALLLRERLGSGRSSAKPSRERQSPHRLFALLERYLPNRTGVTATVLLLLGS